MSRGPTQPDQPPPGRAALAPNVYVPEGVLDFSFSSSSGPGGQNVNKRATKCRLRIRLGDLPIPLDAAERIRSLYPWLMVNDDLVIECDENRTQERNRDGCLERVREVLVRALVRPKRRKATKPSRGAKERRLQEKKRTSGIKKHRRDGGDE